MYNAGDFKANSTVQVMFSTFDSTGASITRSVAGSIRIYKNNGTTERTSSAGITDSNSFDSVTGVRHINIDTSDNTDSGFYAAGNDYFVVLVGSTIDGKTVNSTIAQFSIENRNNRTSNVMFSGTASAGSGTSITLAGASSTDNLYKFSDVEITGGTGAGQRRTIFNYNGTSKVATINRAWATNPDSSSLFNIISSTKPDIIDAGVAQAGAASAITLAADSSSTNDIYNGSRIVITNGTGSGQANVISSYNGTTKVATMSASWTTTPDSTFVYEILSSQSACYINNDKIGYTASTVSDKTGYSLSSSQTFSTSGSVGSVVGNVGGNIAGSLGSLTSGAISGIWDESVANHTINGTFGASAQAVYHADVNYTKDRTSLTDEYTVIWYKNGIPQTSGITSPTIKVVNRGDGSDLVAQTSMTQVGSTGAYKYDAVSSERQSSGNAYLIVVTASIDSGTRTFYRVVGRDS